MAIYREIPNTERDLSKMPPVLAWKKPAPEPTSTPAMVAQEYAQTYAEKADVVVILSIRKDGRYDWVGNYVDTKELVYILERMKNEVIDRDRADALLIS